MLGGNEHRVGKPQNAFYCKKMSHGKVRRRILRLFVTRPERKNRDSRRKYVTLRRGKVSTSFFNLVACREFRGML